MGIQPHHDSDEQLDQVMLPDGEAEVIRLPGVVRFSHAHTALFSAVHGLGSGKVFVAGPGAVPTALWVARAGAGLCYLTDSAAEARALQATLRHNALPPVRSICDWSTQQERCDLALVHLPRGRQLQQEYLRYAAYYLKPGGKLLFVGARNEGVKTAVVDAAGIVGRAGVIARKGGYHAAMAYRPMRDMEAPQLSFESLELVVDGDSTVLKSCVGAFARDRLDGGAAALIASMQVSPEQAVLDMGCGTGLVALAAARRGAQVVATDVSYRAVASARCTLSANNHGSVPVDHTTGADTVRSGVIDTVVTNPPFHQGHDISFEVAQLFVREAARVLRKGGHLYLVANQFLDYAPWLSRDFVIHPPALENGQYRVWHAVRNGHLAAAWETASETASETSSETGL